MMRLNCIRTITRVNLIRNYSTVIPPTASPIPTTTLPKGEKNPAHKSKIALPPIKEPAPIDHSPPASPPLEESFPKKRAFTPQSEEEVVQVEPIKVELLEPLPPRSVPLPSPPPPPSPEPTPVIEAKVRRPVGGFRGGLIGFLLGTTLVGGYGYSVLWDDFKSSSNLLLMSVEQAKSSAEKMNSHVQRIQRVEEELKRFTRDTPSKKDIEDVRSELNKLNSAAHIDHLALKARQWGIEQDLHKLASRGSNEVRI